jgi:transposase InsO family protein
VDNGSCFIAKEFRSYCEEQGIRGIYGSPYHPQGRGKLGRFHGTLTQELMGKVRFRSHSHFRQDLYGYRGRYNRVRIHGGIGWRTPAEVNNDRTFMRRRHAGRPIDEPPGTRSEPSHSETCESSRA